MTLDAGEGREADDGFRRAVRIDDGSWTTDMFVEAVYQEPSGEEVMRRTASARRRPWRSWPAPRRTLTIRTRRPTTSRKKSSSKANWCSSSTATRTRSCTSRRRTKTARRSAGRSSGPAPTQLGSAGVKRETLKVGDEIVVVARPSRVPGEYRALMVTPEAAARRIRLGQRGPSGGLGRFEVQ